MRFRNALKAAVAITTLVAVLPGATAHADSVSVGSYADCPGGWFCAWDGPSGTGRQLRTQVSIPDLSSAGMNNEISSLWNRTDVVWCAYDEPYYRGAALRVGNWIGTLSGSTDNRISSLLRGC
ncbi:peptidase inhibitor family I36 protein [Amycolatopsis lurida]|uniref:peptidase inhibitor family I36 protein n=1 Tax=Amycolatopsis lurida TaxID=31959 RepID=UPI003650E326